MAITQDILIWTMNIINITSIMPLLEGVQKIIKHCLEFVHYWATLAPLGSVP